MTCSYSSSKETLACCMPCRHVRDWWYSSIHSALDKDEWSFHAPATLRLVKQPLAHSEYVAALAEQVQTLC
jgi:hypothetical protein